MLTARRGAGGVGGVRFFAVLSAAREVGLDAVAEAVWAFVGPTQEAVAGVRRSVEGEADPTSGWAIQACLLMGPHGGGSLLQEVGERISAPFSVFDPFRALRPSYG